MKKSFTILLACIVAIALTSCSFYTCPTYAKAPANAKVSKM